MSRIGMVGGQTTNLLNGGIMPNDSPGTCTDKLGDSLKNWGKDFGKGMWDQMNPINWLKPGNFSMRFNSKGGGGFSIGSPGGTSPEMMRMFRELMGTMGNRGGSQGGGPISVGSSTPAPPAPIPGNPQPLTMSPPSFVSSPNQPGYGYSRWPTSIDELLNGGISLIRSGASPVDFNPSRFGL